jgi:hypothetical protein
MKILMLSTEPGSVDGFRVSTYEAGREYDLTEPAGARELAAAFVAAGLAEQVNASPASVGDDEPAGDEEPQEAVQGVDAVPAAPKSGRKQKAP